VRAVFQSERVRRCEKRLPSSTPKNAPSSFEIFAYLTVTLKWWVFVISAEAGPSFTNHHNSK
jgi:hypothetical protein